MRERSGDENNQSLRLTCVTACAVAVNGRQRAHLGAASTCSPDFPRRGRARGPSASARAEPAPALGQAEVNQSPDFAAAGVVPRGRPAASGRVELVAPGATYSPPPGMELRCFLHRDGSAVKFAGAAGAVHLDASEAEQEFGPLVAQARTLLAAHPAPTKAPTPKLATVHRAAESANGAPGDATTVHRALAMSSSQPLPSTTRQKLESSYGADLGRVRVHDDTAADQAARSVQAHAFASGQDIFFRAGQYRPSSTDGQKLLAHEVAHTVQQSGATGDVAHHTDSSELQVSEPGDRLEHRGPGCGRPGDARQAGQD